MLYELISLGFSIDVCHCNDVSVLNVLKRRKYDYIVGFGKVFEEMAKNGGIKYRILFITENNPEVSRSKAQERLEYFKQRHPNIKTRFFIQRDKFYTIEQFKLANIGICMSNEYNAESMRPYFNKFYRINVNGLYNKTFIYKDNISDKRRGFAWFGSNGVIHKGLDILIDAFNEIPEYNLNIYGAPARESKYLKKIAKKNIIFHDKVCVFGEQFISEVVNKNCFTISLSCSEGMNSGIATCMLHGLIPIVTKETGFDPKPFIIELESYRVEYVIDKLKRLSEINDNELKRISLEVYKFAHEELTLKRFDQRFRSIFVDIIAGQIK